MGPRLQHHGSYSPARCRPPHSMSCAPRCAAPDTQSNAKCLSGDTYDAWAHDPTVPICSTQLSLPHPNAPVRSRRGASCVLQGRCARQAPPYVHIAWARRARAAWSPMMGYYFCTFSPCTSMLHLAIPAAPTTPEADRGRMRRQTYPVRPNRPLALCPRALLLYAPKSPPPLGCFTSDRLMIWLG
jgi:hypothetical protein